MQGYYGDLNKWSNVSWNRVAWFRAYVECGIADKSGKNIDVKIITLLGSDAGHKNATYLIDGDAAVKRLSSLSCGIECFDTHRAPTLDPVTDTYKWTFPALPRTKN